MMFFTIIFAQSILAKGIQKYVELEVNLVPKYIDKAGTLIF
jgi:hypothetical protein